MTTTEFESAVAPTLADAEVAQESSRALARMRDQFSAKTVAFKIMTPDPKGNKKIHEETVTVPTAAFRLLANILTEMAKGHAVTLIPVHAELTTQQAANVLNVSRPFVIQLLKEGKIPHHLVGTHRRIRYEDILNYKRDIDKKRMATLEELAKQAQELKMGYDE
jgi:excisionase family DNA binding protein